MLDVGAHGIILATTVDKMDKFGGKVKFDMTIYVSDLRTLYSMHPSWRKERQTYCP